MLIKHIWRIERERRRLKHDNTPLHDREIFGAGSKFEKRITVSDIATNSSTPLWKCLILYYFAKRANRVLELGTGLGFSTAYLALGSKNGGWSIEADVDILRKVWESHNHLPAKCRDIHHAGETFDKFLDTKYGPSNFNLAYIDGDHTGDALVKYFTNLLPLLTPKAVIICDDVIWSEDMHRGYLKCCTGKTVKRHLRIHDFGVIWLK